MAPRSSDIAYLLPTEAISLEVWSADYINFQIEDKVIRTTLKNTVLDVKEVIAKRSNEISGKLNVKAIQLKYRNQVYGDDQKLGEFLVQEKENTRIQVLIDPKLLASLDQVSALMNINLKLSSGRKILLRESLNTTIRSIKYALVEDLRLSGLQDIITLEYNAGEEIQERDETQISEILKLDTVPVDDLNIYVRLKDDFLVKLASPSENILRIDKMVVCTETTISSIKQFIVDQYNGAHNIDTQQIKIIYFGRVLTDDSKLSQILSGSDTSVNSLITLHFVINEPEPVRQSGGFWSDLTRGNSLFEFLPLEPNPNFEADLERDRRLRDRLAGNLAEEQDPLEGSSSLQEQHQEPTLNSVDSETLEFNNSAPTLPNAQLIGESYDTAIADGEEVYLNQKDTATTVYEFTLNTTAGPKKVTLPSSQAIINDTDPETPYIMLSSAGFARLKTLGVQINPPKVILSESSHNHTTHTRPVTATPSQTIPALAPTQNHQLHTPPVPAPSATQNRGSFQQLRMNGGIVNVRRFSIRVNSASVTRIFQISGRLIYNIGKLYLFYALIISQIQDNFQRKAWLFLLVIYAVTNGSIRNLFNELVGHLPDQYREFTSRYVEGPERFIRSVISGGSSSFMRSILECLPSRTANSSMELFDNMIRRVIVALVLFFTSIFPPLHDTFTRQLQELTEERTRREHRFEQEALVARSQAQQLGGEEEEEVEVEVEEQTQAVEQAMQQDPELLADDRDMATGVQVHHEN